MKRSMFSRLALIAILAVAVSACSKKSEYINVIPADATVVASINLKSLAEKGGLKDKENEEAKQKLVDALQNGMSAATFQQIEMILKDPKKSGIDVTEPLYVFNSETFPYTSLVAKVSDENDLNTLLKTLEDEKLCQAVASGDGYQFTLMNNRTILAYNPFVFMLIEYKGATQLEKIKESIPGLLKQTYDNSVASTAAFKKMQKMGGDMNTFFSLASLPGADVNQIYGVSKDIDMKDLKLLGSISFDKGKITIKYENSVENPELKALFDKQTKAICPIENTYLKHFPQSTLMLGSMGVNGEEFYNLLVENEEFRKNLPAIATDEVKNLFGAFQKDITIGLTNITMNGVTFLACANVKSATPVQMLYEKKNELGLKRSEDIVQLGENEYVYKSRMMNVFFGVHGNNLYITNDEALYKNIDESADPSANDTQYASNMKGKSSACAINVEAILALPVVKMLAEYGGAQYATALNLADKVSYMEAIGTNSNAEMIIHLKDKNVNALKQIVDFIKQFAGV
ncbi:DUF4836 family protein [Bacteroides sp. UBA939]|uniref:DUF4836 family protein n=1 Tax=Bacteroides sp. UBA939 TaxID=1946092 RepID=UPI0025B7B201|nr:DUF4836 family protein [Bacteroides sp. UBA939]